jgi:membrane protein
LYERSNDDRLLATAAGVVFFGLLAVFPAVTALVSSYGLFADPGTIGANLQTLGLLLPEGSFQIVQDQIARVLAKGPAALGGTFLFGLALALWSANAGVKAIIDALNVVHKVRETRSFIRLNLLSLAFTTGGIAALLLMVSAVVAFPLAFNHIGLSSEGGFILGLARWPLLLVILLVALSVLYRFGPNRPAARWEWTGAGTIAAALLWIAGSAALSWYLSNFGNYNATYGSLGAAIGLMMWLWMSATVVLFGAELNSEIELQTAGR